MGGEVVRYLFGWTIWDRFVCIVYTLFGTPIITLVCLFIWFIELDFWNKRAKW